MTLLFFEQECEFRRYDFYPGQKLVGTCMQYEEAQWINTTPAVKAKLAASDLTKHATKIKVTVQNVEASHWLILGLF